MGRNMSTRTDPEVRAAFLAALEHGVSPLVNADYRREVVAVRACPQCGKATKRAHRRPIDCERAA